MWRSVNQKLLLMMMIRCCCWYVEVTVLLCFPVMLFSREIVLDRTGSEFSTGNLFFFPRLKREKIHAWRVSMIRRGKVLVARWSSWWTDEHPASLHNYQIVVGFPSVEHVRFGKLLFRRKFDEGKLLDCVVPLLFVSDRQRPRPRLQQLWSLRDGSLFQENLGR